MRAFIAAVLLVAIIVCTAVLIQPKEMFCDNGTISGNSQKYLKNDNIVVIQSPNGKIQAFKPSECK